MPWVMKRSARNYCPYEFRMNQVSRLFFSLELCVKTGLGGRDATETAGTLKQRRVCVNWFAGVVKRPSATDGYQTSDCGR